MKTDKITEIVNLMIDSDLTEFEIEDDGFKLRIKRGKGDKAPTIFPTQLAPAIVSSSTNVPFPMPAAVGSAAEVPASSHEKEKDYEYVKSPMVGTFYVKPSPDSKAYVSKDSKVVKDTVVCIIEAMKVMNEIQAETEGTILEVLVEDGSTVEFGQNLFKIKKS